NGVRRLVDRRNREETSAGRKRILNSCILDHDATTGGAKARRPIAEPSGPAPDVQSFGTAELAGRVSDVFLIRFRHRGYRLGRLNSPSILRELPDQLVTGPALQSNS